MRLRIGGHVPTRGPGHVEAHCVIRTSKTNTFAGLGEIPINRTIPALVKYRKGHNHHCRHRSKLHRTNLAHRIRSGEFASVESRKLLEQARVLSLQIDRLEESKALNRKLDEYTICVKLLHSLDSELFQELVRLERSRGIIRARLTARQDLAVPLPEKPVIRTNQMGK